MTSEPTAAFVWIWLPDAVEPVVCGRLDDDGRRISFTYARSYLDRPDAVALYEPELPLRRGTQYAVSGNRLPLCIDDAMPDSWGRRLVNRRLDQPHAELGELTYLLNSGSDRIGALDFQERSDEYAPREADHPTLDVLATAAEHVETGKPLDADLADALLRGTSIGGARPKALLDDAGRRLIAKFSSTTDYYPVVQGEFVAMELARRAGVGVAGVQLVEAAGKRALLVERFDRGAQGQRYRIVSALTVLALTAFPEGRYARYTDLADQIRARFVRPDESLRELFARISFNILCGNTDDHGRNHAALVQPEGLELTPAYDICPQARSGETARQALAYSPSGERDSNVWKLVAAANHYHLEFRDARDIVRGQIATIESNWDEVSDLAQLTQLQRDAFRGTQFLNPHSTAT